MPILWLSLPNTLRFVSIAPIPTRVRAHVNSRACRWSSQWKQMGHLHRKTNPRSPRFIPGYHDVDSAEFPDIRLPSTLVTYPTCSQYCWLKHMSAACLSVHLLTANGICCQVQYPLTVLESDVSSFQNISSPQAHRNYVR